MQHIIIGNFGNHSLAAMQFLLEKGVGELHFAYVETGWAAFSWAERVQACSHYARQQGVSVHSLNTQATFSAMVLDRKQFPSRKFQWCASFLKGLTIIDFLDQQDPNGEALIVSGKRQRDSRRYVHLQEFEYEDDLYQGRTLWHPLWQTSNDEFMALIKRTGFQFLAHQSLECSPCIHANTEELAHLEPAALARLDELEQAIDQTMYGSSIQSLCVVTEPSKPQEGLNLHQFDLGCGAPWGCGE